MRPVALVGGVSRLILVVAHDDFRGGALLARGDLLDVLDRVQRLRHARPHGGCRRRQTVYQLVSGRSGLQWNQLCFV